MKKSTAIAVGLSIGVLALASVYSPALHAQSADLVLCDRIAADPSDPDKPKDVLGVTALGNPDAKAAIKRLDCPRALKDKQGNVLANLC